MTEARTRSPEMEKQAVSPLKERPHDYTSNRLQVGRQEGDLFSVKATPPK